MIAVQSWPMRLIGLLVWSLVSVLGIFGPWAPHFVVFAQTPTLNLAPERIDIGWNGAEWNKPFPAGSSVTLQPVYRCAGNGDVCASNADCSGKACLSTCDPLLGTVCELAGPRDTGRCLQTMTGCTANIDCGSGRCVRFAAPPSPSAANGVPVCVANILERDVTGTYDFASGHSTLSLSMLRIVHLGFTLESPCPVCGGPSQDPKVGDQFQCLGGLNDGAPCLVAGVTTAFGGVSYDCPPDPHWNISGPGIPVRVPELTTRSVSVRANLPCGPPYDAMHPDNGPSVCLDDFSACSTNADCKRCESNLGVSCLDDTDCPGAGRCLSAPAIPITCGVYCHCGYCGGNPDQPCFADTQCSPPDRCLPGQSAAARPQAAPNACSGLLCGIAREEECCALTDGLPCARVTDTPRVGNCSMAAYQSCRSDDDCRISEGTCILTNRPCFENVIERSGSPASADGTSPSTYVGLACVPGTASAAVNLASGLPGPAAIRFRGSLLAGTSPQCGNGLVEPGEQCDGGPCCSEFCLFAATGTPCSEPDACRLPDRCTMGRCLPAPGGEVNCDDENDCTTDRCDTTTGGCVHVNLSGTPCSDGDPTTLTRCEEGVCLPLETPCADQPLPADACEIADRAVFRVIRPIARDLCTIDCCDEDPRFHNRIVWKWSSAASAPALPCDIPAVEGNYRLCIYDDDAGSSGLAAVVGYPDSSGPGLRPRRCSYADGAICTAAEPARLRLWNPRKGGRRIRLGHPLGLADLLPASNGRMFEKNPAVTAQLINRSGDCWSSRFPNARKNNPRGFRARSLTNRLP